MWGHLYPICRGSCTKGVCVCVCSTCVINAPVYTCVVQIDEWRKVPTIDPPPNKLRLHLRRRSGCCHLHTRTYTHAQSISHTHAPCHTQTHRPSSPGVDIFSSVRATLVMKWLLQLCSCEGTHSPRHWIPSTYTNNRMPNYTDIELLSLRQPPMCDSFSKIIYICKKFVISTKSRYVELYDFN